MQRLVVGVGGNGLAGKKNRTWGVTSCRRGKALSGGGLSAIHRARANPPTSAAAVVGQGEQRAGNARDRAGAGSQPSGPQQFSPLSQPRMDYDIRDDSLAEPVDLIG